MMIIDLRRQDVFKGGISHIAFAVNTEGHNDAGFAGMVAHRYWSELANTGSKQLGDVLTKTVNGVTLHALVCHSLGEPGWKHTPDVVTACLDKLDIPDDMSLGVVLMGAGMVGQMGGADVFGNLGGMARSKQKVIVFTL